jgi:thiosulfate/3-mercaptopyruvate sulfurtransferase
MTIRDIAAVGVLLMVIPLAAQQTSPPPVSLLVSTAWLAEHLRDPGVVVLQTSQSPERAEQIPGARVVPHGSLMTMSDGHDLAATADLVAALERAGVSNSSHIVIYGEPLAAGWLFFALDYLGHERTSLLDGGLEKWKAEGRPLSRVAPVPANGRFQPRLRPEVKSSAEDLQRRERGVGAVLDARSEREYVAGHIPGARLLTWEQVYADQKLQTFKRPEEVAALFAAAGAPRGASVITYCQIGLRSSLLYFAARYAGLNASNYVRSWNEWSAKGLPTEPAR